MDHPLVLLGCKPDSLIRSRQISCDFTAVVCRIIINQDQFKVAEILVENALNGTNKGFLSIEEGEYYRYVGSFFQGNTI